MNENETRYKKRGGGRKRGERKKGSRFKKKKKRKKNPRKEKKRSKKTDERKGEKVVGGKGGKKRGWGQGYTSKGLNLFVRFKPSSRTGKQNILQLERTGTMHKRRRQGKPLGGRGKKCKTGIKKLRGGKRPKEHNIASTKNIQEAWCSKLNRDGGGTKRGEEEEENRSQTWSAYG